MMYDAFSKEALINDVMGGKDITKYSPTDVAKLAYGADALGLKPMLTAAAPEVMRALEQNGASALLANANKTASAPHAKQQSMPSGPA